MIAGGASGQHGMGGSAATGGSSGTGGGAGSGGSGGSGGGTGTGGTGGGSGTAGTGGGLGGGGGSGAGGTGAIGGGNGGIAGMGAVSGDASIDAPADALDCPDGSVPVGAMCRTACATSSDCGGILVCVEGACFAPPEVCGACTQGTCPSTQVCREAADSCDAVEFCDGSSTNCPADDVEPTGVLCRSGDPQDHCDRDESCDGSSKLCPDDVDLSCPAATVCTAGGECALPNGHAVAFLTSTTWSLVASPGLAGADALCQARANAVNLEGDFVALMSTSVVDARDRIPDQAYYRVDDMLIANDKADLFDGSIANSISLYENGGVRTTAGAATGSNPDGTAHTHTCEDWTNPTSSATFRFGNSGTTNTFWISIGQVGCGPIVTAVYCFQN